MYYDIVNRKPIKNSRFELSLLFRSLGDNMCIHEEIYKG